ncbi:MAG TPA: porin family protein [Flavipsychrobacter sp.]|nr:porin family protein [Flavipsychrobacter sp.]
MVKNRVFGAFIAFTIIALGTGFNTFAQNPGNYYVEDPRTFYGGLLIGTNFSQVDGDSYAGYHKIGLNAGGIMYVNLADHLAGSVEILFSQKGSRGHKNLESANGALISKYRIDLNYAEVPVQINYFDKRRSHFGAGVSYSQLISSREEIVAGGQPVPTDSLKFRKADINLLLSGNLHLVKGLFLNLRFQYSLIPIRTKENINLNYGRSEQYNNMFVLRLMYLF